MYGTDTCGEGESEEATPSMHHDLTRGGRPFYYGYNGTHTQAQFKTLKKLKIGYIYKYIHRSPPSFIEQRHTWHTPRTVMM